MSLNSYIMLSSYHVELYFFNIMSLNSYVMLSSCHDELCLFHIMSLSSYNLLCCHHVMVSCACSILCRWVVRLCCIHIMMSCPCSILCRWVVILCCHHVIMGCACSMLCRWKVRLYCILMSCACSILCRWIVILYCYYVMMSCARFILYCWRVILYCDFTLLYCARFIVSRFLVLLCDIHGVLCVTYLSSWLLCSILVISWCAVWTLQCVVEKDVVLKARNDLTSETSHFGNVQFSSQITSHSPSLARPISNNTPDRVMRCWGCSSPGSFLSWFIFVKGTTGGEYILTESKFGAKTRGVYYYFPFPEHNNANLHKGAIDIETSKYEDQGQWLGMQWIGLIYYSSSFMWSMKELSSIAFP